MKKFKKAKTLAPQGMQPNGGGGALSSNVSKLGSKEVIRHAEFISVSQMQEKGTSKRKVAFTLAEVLITLGIIGVVTAMTLPSVITNYQKKVTVERLKKTYSTLSQAVQMSIKDNDNIETWDFSLSTQEFMEKYVIPYVKDVARENPPYDVVRNSKKFALADGTTVEAWSWVHPEVKPFVELRVDINGKNKPNAVGRDIFFFHIFSQKSGFYNGGEGDVAQNIPSGGLYPDGYGYDRNRLMTNIYRGCNNRIATKDENSSLGIGGSHRGAYCTALIMLDGWKISDDYKW